MRPLTRQEIENAPDWANSAYVDSAGMLTWFNNETGEAKVAAWEGDTAMLSRSHYAFNNCEPIPRTEFDIFSAKFNGELGIEQADELSITITEYEQAVTIGINEAEIFAKHFGLIK